MRMCLFLVLLLSLGFALPSFAGGCSDLHGSAHDQCLVARDQARQQERQRGAQAEQQKHAADAARQQQERIAREEAQRKEQQRRDQEKRAKQEQEEARARALAATGGCSTLRGSAHDQCLVARDQARQQERVREAQRQEMMQRVEHEQRNLAVDAARVRQQGASALPPAAIPGARPPNSMSTTVVGGVATPRAASLPNKSYYQLNVSEQASFNVVIANAKRLRAQGDDQGARRITDGLPPELRVIGTESVFGNARPAGPSVSDAASFALVPESLAMVAAGKTSQAILLQAIREIDSGIFATIAGKGAVVLRDEPRLVAAYGGKIGDWEKIVTKNVYKRIDGTIVQVHAYRNILTRQIVEAKEVFSRSK